MKKQKSSTKAQIIRSAFILIAFTALAALPFALAQRQNSVKQSASPPQASTGAVTTFKAFPPTAQSFSTGDRFPAKFTPMQAQVLDLPQLGIQPLPLNLSSLLHPNPDDGAMGYDNAYMAVTADVVPPSTTRAVGAVFSGFTAGETMNLYFNGILVGTSTVDTNGHLGVFLNTGAGSGYITIDGIGQTSGKRAGGATYVSATAPSSPGFTMTPHALAVNGANLFYFMGTRHAASTSINIAVDGTLLGTIPSDANGSFYFSFAPGAAADSSHVWTAYLSSVGSLGATSVEYRADAGTGDLNTTRAYIDRPVVNSATGGIMALSAEGFFPLESVTLSGCGSGSAPADLNGALSAFLVAGPGVGNYNCTFTGGTSGRVARATARGDSLATGPAGFSATPAGINAPSTLRSNATSFLFSFDRLIANEQGDRKSTRLNSSD